MKMEDLQTPVPPRRFIGLDVHKHYLIAVGVDAERKTILGPTRVELVRLESWIQKTLTQQDDVVLEATTNAYQLYDDLQPYVRSVILVHPPHIALITRAQVMNDKIAARILAQFHAAGLLTGIWVPPQAVRDLRALLAQRTKMTRLSTQAKNRLHAVLQRHHLPLPNGEPFAAAQLSWWRELPISALELARVQCDLDTLAFARRQIEILETTLKDLAAQDDRVPLLIQLPGFGLIVALTILAAIGEISRFPDAAHLVGYAGLGARVHDSGQTRRTGGITKAGRRELRAVMIEAAQSAVLHHPHWKAELARLEPRLGRNKAITAIARKLLVTVWHILSHPEPDRHIAPERLAYKLIRFSESLGSTRRAVGLTAAAYARQQMDRLGVGADLDKVALKPRKTVTLPPSRLKMDT